ncbi:MAG: hypothetical protein AB1716_06555 [Planctomycetota bacterium]
MISLPTCWSSWRLPALVLGGVLFLSLGGCPIDGDEVITEAVRAVLTAATDSLVENLSTYLAGQ